MTGTDRNKRYEDRRRAEGQVRVTVWVPNESFADDIRYFAKEMREGPRASFRAEHR